MWFNFPVQVFRAWQQAWCNTGVANPGATLVYVANPATNKKQETRNNGNQRDRLDSGLVYLLHDSFVEVS